MGRTLVRVLVVGAGAAALLGGCGGGGGGGHAEAAPTGKAAIHYATVSAYHSLGAGMSFPNQVLRMTAPANSGIGESPLLPGGTAALLQEARTKGWSARPYGRSLAYYDLLNLYVGSSMSSANTLVLTFYSDSGGLNQVGTATLKSSAATLTPTTFPYTIDGSINVTGGNLPMKGTCQFKYMADTGRNTLTGTLELPKDDLKFDVDMTLSDTLQVGGSATIKEHSQTIVGTNISGTLDQVLSCDVSVQPGAATGTGTLDFLHGTISLNLTTGQGPTSAEIDGSGNLVIHYPDGSAETITDPITAPVVGDGGSGGNTDGGTTQTAYGAPVAFGSSSDYLPFFSGNGNLAGYDHSTFLPIYLTSPSGTSKPGVTGGYQGAYYQGLSEVGTAVGEGNATAYTGFQPLFWSTLGGAPTPIAVPEGYTPGRQGGWAQGVNANGQIVGFFDFGTTSEDVVATYWATPGTAPAKLKDESGKDASDLTGVAITDSGAILGSHYYYSQASTKGWYVWASPTSNAQALAKTDFGAESVSKLFINQSGLVAGTGSDGLGYVWSPPSYAPVALKLFAGDTQATILGLNDSGEIIGSTSTKDVVLWTSPTADPIDLTAVAANGTGLRPIPIGIDNSGRIVFEHQAAGGGYFVISPK